MEFRLPTNEFDASYWLPHGGLVFNKGGDGNDIILMIWPANEDGIVRHDFPSISCIGPTGPTAPVPSKIDIISAD